MTPKIVSKFKYPIMDRETQESGFREYITPPGPKVPSVTTILGCTKPQEDADALQNWRDAIGEYRANEITNEASQRGTRMHGYLEKYILEGKLKKKGTNPFGWPSHDMAQVIIDEGLCKMDEYWGVEVPLYYPDIYAGTTDVIGVHEGTPAILDFKQSNKIKDDSRVEDYKMQLAAYAEAHNEVYGTNIRKGIISMCVKPTEITPGVYSKEPQYLEWIIEGKEFDKYKKKWWDRVKIYYEQLL